MRMRLASAVVLALALTLPAVAQGQAFARGDHRHDLSARYRVHHVPHPVYRHWRGAYAYVPRHFRTQSDENEYRCQLSPSSLNYEPCFNRP